MEYPHLADKERKTTEAGQLIKLLGRDGQNADCPQEWWIPNSWGSGRQPRRHTTGQRMPGYSPGIKGTDARRHTPTCLQLGANQAAAWPLARCGWAGLGGLACPCHSLHRGLGHPWPRGQSQDLSRYTPHVLLTPTHPSEELPIQKHRSRRGLKRAFASRRRTALGWAGLSSRQSLGSTHPRQAGSLRRSFRNLGLPGASGGGTDAIDSTQS